MMFILPVIQGAAAASMAASRAALTTSSMLLMSTHRRSPAAQVGDVAYRHTSAFLRSRSLAAEPAVLVVARTFDSSGWTGSAA